MDVNNITTTISQLALSIIAVAATVGPMLDRGTALARKWKKFQAAWASKPTKPKPEIVEATSRAINFQLATERSERRRSTFDMVFAVVFLMIKVFSMICGCWIVLELRKLPGSTPLTLDQGILLTYATVMILFYFMPMPRD